jgi:beta-glucosidase
MIHDGLVFRDLDHDGVLAPYEDWRRSPHERATDLISRMTLPEKVGLMMHGTAVALGGPLARIGIGDEYGIDELTTLVVESHVNSFITRLRLSPAEIAAQNNRLQTVAASGRLGIPLTISTDPRNHFTSLTGASVDAAGFSQWPGTLGLAATRDRELVRRFGDVLRQEYRAVGIQMALSPQADLATVPRWPRIDGTFGSDPALVRSLVGAYVEGIQGGPDGVTTDGVAAVVKHWVGYGASRDGFDGHNYYGRFSAFPNGDLQDHIDAFLDALAANVSGVMPTYNILEGVEIDGEPLEPMGAGFSRVLIDGLLRSRYAFEGVVLSDWGITKDINESCRSGVPPQTPELIAMPWGVEELTRIEKFAKGVNAGLDQFGGENDPAALLAAVEQGLVAEERIDRSAYRILVQKFVLGLFDDPFVDAGQATALLGSAEVVAEARTAQARSLTLVAGEMRPLRTSAVVYLHRMEPDVLTARGIATTDDLDRADVAIVRLSTPFELLHPGHFFGRMQHEGRLDFADDHPDLAALVAITAKVPAIVIIHLDRPADVANIVDKAEALIGEFGVADEVLVDVLMAGLPLVGRLPFVLDTGSARDHRSCGVRGG